MAIQVQIRRGTTSENNAFTGASGEITCDTEAHTLRIHDGTTAGGFIVDQSANVVHKAGAETITGAKSFSGGNDATGPGSSSISITGVNTETGVEHYKEISFSDSNNKRIGVLRALKDTSDKRNVKLGVVDSNNTWRNGITIQCAADGTNSNVFLDSHPAASSATGDKVVPTTGWINDYQLSTNLVHRDSTETITGNKTFSGDTTFTQWPKAECTTNARTDTASYMTAYRLVDKNGKPIGELSSKGDTAGNKFTCLFACTDNGGSDVWTEIISGGKNSSNNSYVKILGTGMVMWVKEFWNSGNNWYKIYSNNWIEQGGTATGANFWVGFHKKMNPGFVIVSGFSQYAGERMIQLYPADGTTTGFRIYNRGDSQTSAWFAAGFAA